MFFQFDIFLLLIWSMLLYPSALMATLAANVHKSACEMSLGTYLAKLRSGRIADLNNENVRTITSWSSTNC